MNFKNEFIHNVRSQPICVQILGFDYYNPSYLLANLRSYEKRFETLPYITRAICEINLEDLKSDRSYFFADQKNRSERLHNLLYNIARVLALYKSY